MYAGANKTNRHSDSLCTDPLLLESLESSLETKVPNQSKCNTNLRRRFYMRNNLNSTRYPYVQCTFFLYKIRTYLRTLCNNLFKLTWENAGSYWRGFLVPRHLHLISGTAGVGGYMSSNQTYQKRSRTESKDTSSSLKKNTDTSTVLRDEEFLILRFRATNSTPLILPYT